MQRKQYLIARNREQEKKGALLSQGMSDEASEVVTMINDLNKLVICSNAREAFDQARDPAKANKLVVSLGNVDSSVMHYLPESVASSKHVALAVLDAHGGNLLSAAHHLVQLSDENWTRSLSSGRSIGASSWQNTTRRHPRQRPHRWQWTRRSDLS